MSSVGPGFPFAFQGVLQNGFADGVVSSDVAKPGELDNMNSFTSDGVHLLSHIFGGFV